MAIQHTYDFVNKNLREAYTTRKGEVKATNKATATIGANTDTSQYGNLLQKNLQTGAYEAYKAPTYQELSSAFSQFQAGNTSAWDPYKAMGYEALRLPDANQGQVAANQAAIKAKAQAEKTPLTIDMLSPEKQAEIAAQNKVVQQQLTNPGKVTSYTPTAADVARGAGTIEEYAANRGLDVSELTDAQKAAYKATTEIPSVLSTKDLETSAENAQKASYSIANLEKGSAIDAAIATQPTYVNTAFLNSVDPNNKTGLTRSQELDIAYQRYLNGTATDADFNNLDYAINRQGWRPTVKEAAMPGANPNIPETMTPASPTISAPDGTIDITKFMTSIQENLNSINDLIAEERAAFDMSSVELGAQLGKVMPLIQGEQAYQEARKNVVLQRLVDEKANVLESGELQMKIYDYARQLRQDQQDALAATFDLYLKNGMPITDSMASQMESLTGIGAGVWKDGYAVAAQNYLKEQNADELDFQRKLSMEGYQYISNPADLAGLSEDQLWRDPATGRVYKKPVEPVKTGGSSSILTTEEKAFQSDLKDALKGLASGELAWGQAWNFLQSMYGTPNEILDALLRKDLYYPKEETTNSGGGIWSSIVNMTK